MKTPKPQTKMTAAEVRRLNRFLAILSRGAKHRVALSQSGVTWRYFSALMCRSPEWAQKYEHALMMLREARVQKKLARFAVLQRRIAPLLPEEVT